MEAEIDILCGFLEELSQGLIQGKDAKVRLDALSALSMTDLGQLYGNLHHYINDEEIRIRDPGYKELQNSEMKKLLLHLKSRAFVKANAITFLEKT